MASLSPIAPAFEFTVSEPEKKERAGVLDFSYWTYHIYTKTSSSAYSKKELVCVRRYNDFAWLRAELVEQYPGVIVPPVPEKSIKGALEKVVSLNANPLLEYRQRALHKFLVRVGAHPLLSTAEVLKEFLELPEEEFNLRKDAPKKKAGPSLSQSLKELTFALSKTVGNTPLPYVGTVGALTESSPAAPATTSPAAIPASPSGDQWADTKQYMDHLERSLVLLKDRIELLVKRRRETSSSLQEFGKSFVKISEIERSYEEGPLSKALTDVGHHAEHLSIVYQEQADNEIIQVVETIHYYVGLTNAVRDVIKRIQKLVLTKETMEHGLAQLVEKQSKLRQGGKEDALRKLELEISNATQRKEEATSDVTAVEEIFRQEVRRFHQEKQYDIKSMLKAFVDLQKEYADKMKTSWESVVPSINAIPTGVSHQ